MENKYIEFSDEQLVRLAQEGDGEAEEFLIGKYKDVVKGKAHLYFIVGADSEDVVQEGMIGIFKAIKGYDISKQATFRTFAELCINRQIITAIKRANRLKHSPLNTSVSLNKPMADGERASTLAETLSCGSDTDPEELLLLKEIVGVVVSNGGKIFSGFEMSVLNEYLQGKSYTKIAADMHKDPKTIDNAIQRTKKKIATYLRN